MTVTRRTLLAAAAAIPLAARAQVPDWSEIVRVGRGQPVAWNAWAGDDRTNAFIAWAAERMRMSYDVSVQHVRLRDTSEAVARVVADRAAGKTGGGAVDLVWINGPNFLAMKRQSLLYGPILDRLPHARLIDRAGKPMTEVDFTVPVDGLEVPWRMAQVVFVHDTARVPDPPRSMASMLGWSAAHPGRLTHPTVRNFLGATFLKQALYALAPDPAVLQAPAGDDGFGPTTAPLWAWYDRLRPTLWRGGTNFPESGPAQRALMNDGEIDLMISFSPTEAVTGIANGTLPPTVRAYVLDGGTIGNCSFNAVPFNAAHPEAAMLLADFLLSPEAQAHGMDPRQMGSPTVLDIARLAPADRALFDELPQPPGTLTQPELGRPLLEPHASWMTRIAAEWNGASRFKRMRATTLGLVLLLLPAAGGLAATLLPAFGYLPALGGVRPSLDPWRELAAWPGFGRAILLTLGTGLAATTLSTGAAMAVVVLARRGRVLGAMQAALAPILATPHVAIAIGWAFLAAPSGWIARLISPWLTGWTTPPDLATVQDPLGVGLVIGMCLKETPYLVLVTLAALAQSDAARAQAVASGLGYGPWRGWLLVVLPRVWPQIRLPVMAVLAFSLSVVDMALVLGPATPPTLAVQLLRWFADPDLSRWFPASAGAVLLSAIVLACLAGLLGIEALAGRAGRVWLRRGARGGDGRGADMFAAAIAFATAALSLAALVMLAFWSLTSRWPFPAALPEWSLATWRAQTPGLLAPTATTLWLGATVTGIAVALSVVGLAFGPVTPPSRLLYAPLLVPQIGFLFGAQIAFARLGLDGGIVALLWSHLLFVLPYVVLSLVGPFRALDPRLRRTAACLGASPLRVLFRVALPMLARPLSAAGAIGFATSAGLYLPTLFAGGGRWATLTTEALALSSGADRRILAATALLQAALPLLAFAFALGWPAWRARRRAGLGIVA